MPPEDGINIGFDQGTVSIVTSHPDKIQRHNISDEELDMLCESRTHMVLEILLIAAGGLIATLPAIIPAIYGYFKSETNSINLAELVQVNLFFACLFVIISTALIYSRKKTGSKSLRDTIRDRQNK